MKKQVIITIILLLATAFITVVYFKNLNTPGMRTSQVMRAIPDNASLIFEFNNEKSFYDIFNSNKLLTSVIGEQQIDELDVLRRTLLSNPLLEKYFTGQNIFISIHPSKTNTTDLLLSIAAANGFEPDAIEQSAKQPNSGLLITPMHTAGGVQGFNIYISALKKRFYVVNSAENVFSGSFSKELIDQFTANKNDKGKPRFVLLSEQQSANSLANLYVNYAQLQPLFDQLFKNTNTDIFKSLRLLPGLATLSLNYKTDALMFNGLTTIQENKAASYLSLFTDQQPVVNHLKDIFPSTTAYSINFAVSDPLKFGADLSKWYEKAGIKSEESQLFSKILAETGINLKSSFNNLIDNEFAIVTTRYFEKFAIVSVKDGSRLKLIMATISKMTDENSGQLSYEKLPFFLLGDAFSVFRRPYFLIIDNYLVFANSHGELSSYYDSYINRKFLSKNDQYIQFDNLLAAQSNVAFLFNFKNAEPILKRDLDSAVYNNFQLREPGWKNFYLASWQFTAADKNFYTNFSMRLNTDTTTTKNK
jgi:hypothetical protein